MRKRATPLLSMSLAVEMFLAVRSSGSPMLRISLAYVVTASGRPFVLKYLKILLFEVGNESSVTVHDVCRDCDETRIDAYNVGLRFLLDLSEHCSDQREAQKCGN